MKNPPFENSRAILKDAAEISGLADRLVAVSKKVWKQGNEEPFEKLS